MILYLKNTSYEFSIRESFQYFQANRVIFNEFIGNGHNSSEKIVVQVKGNICCHKNI